MKGQRVVGSLSWAAGRESAVRSGSSPPTAPAKPRRPGASVLVPGLVAGASDIDPTTVATMAVVGASTVFGLSWLALLMFPALAGIQVIASRVGTASGTDLQGCVNRRFGRRSQAVLAVSVLAVSVITLAADLEGVAAAVGLLVGADWHWFVVPLAAALLAMLGVGAYAQVQRFLRYAALCLLAYVVAAFLAHVRWAQVARATLEPSLHLTSSYVSGALALVGTTLTSYVYVWQTIEEAEDAPDDSQATGRHAGATLGILVSVILFWFILVTTGATLGVHHLPVTTARQAAQALRPVAGAAASKLFGVGLLASGAIALPVITSTCAYVVAEAMGWPRGLSQPLPRARPFYAVVLAVVVAGVGVAFSGIAPIHLLYVASIVGGLGTPLGMVYLLVVASDHRIMAGRPIGSGLKAWGWCVTAMVGAMTVVFLVRQVAGAG